MVEEGWKSSKNIACSLGIATCNVLFVTQSPMGDGDQGSNAEVP